MLMQRLLDAILEMDAIFRSETKRSYSTSGNLAMFRYAIEVNF